MRQWFELGYFEGTLPISNNPNGPFNALNKIFPDPKNAFAVSEKTQQVNHEASNQLKDFLGVGGKRGAQGNQQQQQQAAAAAAAQQQQATKQKVRSDEE
jgi:hypothetical protein